MLCADCLRSRVTTAVTPTVAVLQVRVFLATRRVRKLITLQRKDPWSLHEGVMTALAGLGKRLERIEDKLGIQASAHSGRLL